MGWNSSIRRSCGRDACTAEPVPGLRALRLSATARSSLSLVDVDRRLGSFGEPLTSIDLRSASAHGAAVGDLRDFEASGTTLVFRSTKEPQSAWRRPRADFGIWLGQVYRTRSGRLLVHTGLYCVEFTDTAPSDEISALLLQMGLRLVLVLDVCPTCLVLAIDTNQRPPDQVLEVIRSNILVVDVEWEPREISRGAWRPSDSLYGDQWHWSHPSHKHTNVESAWDITRGSGAKVSIIDFGFRAGTADIVGHASSSGSWGFDETAGYDVFVPTLTPKRNGDQHGTGCVGLCVGRANNDGPGCGAAPEAAFDLLEIPADAPQSTFARALLRGLGCHVEGPAGLQPSQVISASLTYADASSGDAHASLSVRRAVARTLPTAMNPRGSILVMPAAHDFVGQSIDRDELVTLDGVTAVGETHPDGRAGLHAIGRGLDLVAPGENIWMCSAEHPDQLYNSGATSFSTAIVAGISALMFAANPCLDRNQIETLLLTTADRSIGGPFGPSGHSDTYGYGRVDAGAAVSAAFRGC